MSADSSPVSPPASAETVPSARPPDSLGKRYLFKLLSNAAGIPLFFVMEALLPRALGPAAYGNFNFATALFQNFTNFLDLGSSTCLAASLAKRPHEYGLVLFYRRAAAGIFVICMLSGCLALLPAAGEFLMPGVPTWLGPPAALWAWLTWAGRTTRGMNDALGITASSELLRMGISALSALALFLLFSLNLLSLTSLFLHQYFFLALAAAAFCFCMRGRWAGASASLPPGAFSSYFQEFRRYCGPLFVTALASAAALSLERWLLQYFDGSTQQGFFSLSQKVGMACFMFVTAMTPLLMRELSVAHGKNDPREMGRLLDRFAPMLYAAAAWFSCFTLVEAASVVRIFGGEQFAEALLPVQIMALYPVHQAYGQVANAVFYASGRTAALRNLTLGGLVLGLGAAWFLLSPAEDAFFGLLPGLGLGAFGLALKMVAVQFVTVNAMLFACRRFVPFHFRRNLLHQVLCPVVLTAAALAAKFGTEYAGGASDSLWRFLLSGMVYGALTLPLAFVWPFVLGIGRGEAAAQLRRLLRR